MVGGFTVIFVLTRLIVSGVLEKSSAGEGLFPPAELNRWIVNICYLLLLTVRLLSMIAIMDTKYA